MIALGIDLSLTGTGLVAVEGNELHFSECYKPKAKTGPERLIEIQRKVSENIVGYDPDIICLEGYSFGSKGRGVFQTGELGGVIRVLLYEMGIKWLEIPPSQVKKFAAGMGNCGKDIVLQQVYKRWGMEFKTSDEADAFVLAKIGTILLGHEEKLTKKQEEVIKVLKSPEPSRSG
jgi:crossover junction endodeoxyribonuclease RuvC